MSYIFAEHVNDFQLVGRLAATEQKPLVAPFSQDSSPFFIRKFEELLSSEGFLPQVLFMAKYTYLPAKSNAKRCNSLSCIPIRFCWWWLHIHFSESH